jgi:hypothetical protein
LRRDPVKGITCDELEPPQARHGASPRT